MGYILIIIKIFIISNLALKIFVHNLLKFYIWDNNLSKNFFEL